MHFIFRNVLQHHSVVYFLCAFLKLLFAHGCLYDFQQDEPVRTPLDTSDFEFERRKITITALREEIFLEAMRYYPDKWQQYLEEQRDLGNMYSIADYRLLAPGEAQYSSDNDEAYAGR